jgi:hypothetical protein
MLYVSAVIMGLGIGFMEAPIITYVGEISQPEMRGILTSYSGKAAKCRSHYLPLVCTCLLFIGHRGVLPPGVKRLGREADHSPLCSAEAKNAWSHTSTPTICLYGIHKDTLPFIFLCSVRLRKWKFRFNWRHEKYFYVTFMAVKKMNDSITVLRYATSRRLASVFWNTGCQNPETAILKHYCLL